MSCLVLRSECAAEQDVASGCTDAQGLACRLCEVLQNLLSSLAHVLRKHLSALRLLSDIANVPSEHERQRDHPLRASASQPRQMADRPVQIRIGFAARSNTALAHLRGHASCSTCMFLRCGAKHDCAIHVSAHCAAAATKAMVCITYNTTGVYTQQLRAQGMTMLACPQTACNNILRT